MKLKFKWPFTKKKFSNPKSFKQLRKVCNESEISKKLRALEWTSVKPENADEILQKLTRDLDSFSRKFDSKLNKIQNLIEDKLKNKEEKHEETISKD
jgi:glycogen synthase